VFVVKDAIETLKAEESGRALGELQALGAQLVSTDEALRMAGGDGSAMASR